jgi:hypothetical protein
MKLAQAGGIATPSREDLAMPDRKRRNKASNNDWGNLNDPDAKITKTKAGRTHLRGHGNVFKRLLAPAAGLNLSLIMRRLFRIGKPRRAQEGLGSSRADIPAFCGP